MDLVYWLEEMVVVSGLSMHTQPGTGIRSQVILMNRV